MSSRIHIHPSGLGAPHVKKAERDALERDYQAWLAAGNKPDRLRNGETGIKDQPHTKRKKK